MRKRTKAREYALQVLYQVDIRRGDAAELLKEFWGAHSLDPDVRTFAQQLAEGTLAHASEIDQLITTHASNWDLKRMAVVDRNILRLGVFELLYVEDVPPTVCINEAIELAKRFGDEESPKFINGILDAVYKASVKKRTPTDSPRTTGSPA